MAKYVCAVCFGVVVAGRISPASASLEVQSAYAMALVIVGVIAGLTAIENAIQNK